MNRARSIRPNLLGIATFLALSSWSATASAAVVPAEIVLQAGETPTGAASPIASLGSPFAEGSGTLGLGGQLANGDRFIFRDDEVVFVDSTELTVTLSGQEVSLGTAPDGRFIYAPTVDGVEALYTDEGVLAVGSMQAPGLPEGVFSTFLSRPSMIDTGAAFWVTGINDGGGVVTQGRVLYRSDTASTADASPLLQSGDTIDGLTVSSPDGVGFDYQPSLDGLHMIAVVNMDTGSTQDDGFVYIDGGLALQESTSTGGIDNWGNVDIVAINNAGDYVIAGDTDGVAGTDDFVAYNGTIAVREGQVVDGVQLAVDSTPGAIGINNLGWVIHTWSVDGLAMPDTAFFSCDAASLARNSVAILAAGDELDLDGDGVGDGLLVDNINATSVVPTRPLGDDGSIYLSVNIDDGQSVTEAVIRLQGQCCGDGALQGTEACDDGNDDDTDACPSSCQEATCGDGFVQTGVEECDDGNTDDGDGCGSDCNSEGIGSTGLEGTETGDESEGGASSSGADDGGTTGQGEGGGGLTTAAAESGETSGGGDPELTGDDSGCGCTTDSRGFPMWTLLFIGVLRRRRNVATR